MKDYISSFQNWISISRDMCKKQFSLEMCFLTLAVTSTFPCGSNTKTEMQTGFTLERKERFPLTRADSRRKPRPTLVLLLNCRHEGQKKKEIYAVGASL